MRTFIFIKENEDEEHIAFGQVKAKDSDEAFELLREHFPEEYREMMRYMDSSILIVPCDDTFKVVE